jgi:hypothetical protein
MAARALASLFALIGYRAFLVEAIESDLTSEVLNFDNECTADSDDSQCALNAMQVRGVKKCADLMKQCGGKSWTGPTCCKSGLTCTPFDQYLSMCQPEKSGSGKSQGEPTAAPTTTETETTTAEPGPSQADIPCAGELGQCAGADWKGALCCQAGLTCKPFDDRLSLCQKDGSGSEEGDDESKPKSASTTAAAGSGDLAITCRWELEQCGGALWTGVTCCRSGLVCTKVDKYYSHCTAPESGGKRGKGARHHRSKSTTVAPGEEEETSESSTTEDFPFGK